jgi:hypothetical protein
MAVGRVPVRFIYINTRLDKLGIEAIVVGMAPKVYRHFAKKH